MKRKIILLSALAVMLLQMSSCLVEEHRGGGYGRGYGHHSHHHAYHHYRGW